MQRQPHRGQSYVIWGTGTLFFVYSVLVAVVFAVFSGQIQKTLQLSSSDLGGLGAAFFFAVALGQLPAGILLDRVNSRWLLSGFAAMSAVGMGLFAMTDNLLLAYIGRILAGAGTSIACVGAMYLARRWFAPEKFPLLSGITQLLVNLLCAMIIMALTCRDVMPAFRTVMYVLSIVNVGIVILMVCVIRPAPDAGEPDNEEGVSGNLFAGLRHVMSCGSFWLITLFFSASFSVLITYADLWNIPVQRLYGHSARSAASLNNVLLVGIALGGLAAGWLANRIGRRVFCARLFMMLTMLTAGALFFLPVLPLVVVVCLMFALGFFAGGSVLAFAIMDKHISESLHGMAFGLMTMLAYLLSSALQLAIGHVMEFLTSTAWQHTVHMALLPLFIFLCVGAVATLILCEK